MYFKKASHECKYMPWVKIYATHTNGEEFISKID